jgi:outer membrane protein insertion porin family
MILQVLGAGCRLGLPLAVGLGMILLGASALYAQAPGPPGVQLPSQLQAAADEQVVEVLIVGNRAVSREKILAQVRTRPGRPFRIEVVEQDVRRLNRTGMFVDIKTSYQRVPGGRKVIFEVFERPTLQYVKYVGNQKIRRKVLHEEAGLKSGDSLDPFAVEEARRELEAFYHSRGFGLARVSVVEGNKHGDRGAVFLIHEGPKQKILWTGFVGNTIASDARLRTRIRSKPGVFWLFKGEVDHNLVDEDVDRLTAYYRGLGFFRAKIGRELTFSRDRQWATLTFVIDEGPRYKVRDISFVGHGKFTTDQLSERMKLRSGEYFNQTAMGADVSGIREKYGSVGYIFADVKAQPRFLEEPGQLDIVYDISEGHRYRVGRINPQIKGDYPHTKITTILNRISLQPGDIVDVRKLRSSERRLKASGLFNVNPAEGDVPKIVFSPADAEEPNAQLAERPRPEGPQGQNPNNRPGSYPRY